MATKAKTTKTPAKRVAKPKAEKKPIGRPTLKTPELVATIANRLAQGEPLAVICRDEGYPDPSTVRDWMTADPDVSRAIAHGRELGWDSIAHSTRATARGFGDSTQDIQRDKLIIETDLKLLAKWDPKRYGDKTTTELTGADGGAVKFEGVTDKDLDARIAALSKKLGEVK
jgi:hypothetical protein